MADNYPWFKFDAESWLSGKIVYQPLHAQGLFTQIMSLTWKAKGPIPISDLMARNMMSMTFVEEAIKSLTFAGIIENVDGLVSVKFMDELITEYVSDRCDKSKAGKASADARARKKALDEQALNDGSTGVQQNPTEKSRVDDSREDKSESRPKKPRAKKSKKSKPEWQLELEGIGCNHVPSKSINWKRIYDRYGLELITEACEETPASKRWDNVIEDYCSKQKPKQKTIARHADGTLII